MAKTVTVSGADGDLFWVASVQYGDATAWLALAEANGLVTADLPIGLTMLVVPDWQAGFTAYVISIALMSMATTGSALAEADLCNAKVLHAVGAVNNPTSTMSQGSVLDSITQFNVDKHTGMREFCQHGGYCYPETITIDGKTAKSLKLTNCKIDKAVSEDKDTQFWSLEVIRSAVSKETLRYGDVNDKLGTIGMCNACADNATQFYLHKPDSKCGQMVKSALEGNPEATKELAENPDYCQWKY